MKLKVSYSGDIRRLTLPPNIDYAALADLLRQTYSLGPLRIEYKDDEGDLVTMSSDAELTEAIRIASANLLRLNVKLEHPPPSHHPPMHNPSTQWPMWLLLMLLVAPWRPILIISSLFLASNHPFARMCRSQVAQFFSDRFYLTAPPAQLHPTVDARP